MALAAVMSCDSRPDIREPLVISSSAEINGSLSTDAIVQKDCSVHVRGSVTGSLTIEPGADVLVDGSVYGRITNRGGRLVVNHKGLTACVVREGPSESDLGATLKVNLTAIGSNSLLKNPRHGESVVISVFCHESAEAGMRGTFVDQGGLFSYIAPEARVPPDAPSGTRRPSRRTAIGCRPARYLPSS